MPSMASAASWVGAGDLHSSNFGFLTLGAVPSSSACSAVTFNTTVDNAAVLTITGASFNRCHSFGGPFVGCTITATGTKFPWRATALSTTDIRIHDVHIDLRFETTPPAGSTPCNAIGNQLTVTGTLGVGFGTQTVWDPSIKTVTFTNTTGLTAHFLGVIGNLAFVLNGSAVATGSLNIAM
jgi:hypothetical protein